MLNKTIYTKTIEAPAGKLIKNETKIPIIKQMIEIKQLITINPLKLFVNFFAIIAGNTIKLEIKSVPIILIPNTTTNAVIKAIKN